jgi:hypothetical protein
MGADKLRRPAVAAVVDEEALQRAIVGIAGDAGHGDDMVRLTVPEHSGVAPQHARVDGRDHAPAGLDRGGQLVQ